MQHPVLSSRELSEIFLILPKLLRNWLVTIKLDWSWESSECSHVEVDRRFNVTTRRYIPEASKLHTLRRENLKSHKLDWVEICHKTGLSLRELCTVSVCNIRRDVFDIVSSGGRIAGQQRVIFLLWYKNIVSVNIYLVSLYIATVPLPLSPFHSE
jgi:hypothetical protein